MEKRLTNSKYSVDFTQKIDILIHMKDYFLVDIGRDFLTKHRFLSTTLTDKIQETLSS